MHWYLCLIREFSWFSNFKLKTRRKIFLTIKLHCWSIFSTICMLFDNLIVKSNFWTEPLLSLGTPCTSGYYSLGGDTACIPCPGGYSCTTTSSSPVLCTAGNYANNASTTCSPCAAGYYCPTDGMSEPLACPTGYYQTSTGQTSCTQCGQGRSGWG